MSLKRQRIRNSLLTVGLVLLLSPQLLAREFPYQAEVIGIEDLNHNIKRISLKPKDANEFVFTPGQHVFLSVPDEYLTEWNERYKTSYKEFYRPYSFASSPSQGPSFDLIIKHYIAPRGKDVPPGVASTYVHTRLKVGDMVTLSEPNGELYAKDDSDRPIIVVAGGVGVSPFVCLLEHWFENKTDEKRQIYFFLGVRSRRDLILHEMFTKLSQRKENFYYIPALSSPQKEDDWKGKIGYINLVLDKYFTESVDADVYLAGSPIMVRETIKILKNKRIASDRIHRDPIRVR